MADEDTRPYAGQEVEIQDKLLLDAAWERQQKKVSSAVGGCIRGCTQTIHASLCVTIPRQRPLFALCVLAACNCELACIRARGTCHVYIASYNRQTFFRSGYPAVHVHVHEQFLQ